MAFVRVSGYSQTDVDTAYNNGYTAGHTAGYNEGYAAGQAHPSLTTQTQAAYFEPGYFSEKTVTFSFPHGVVGLTSWNSWIAITGGISISGNTVTFSGRATLEQAQQASITAIGY